MREALAAAREGNGSLTLIEGAAGLGKTALLDAARKEARVLGMPTLAARGAELEASFAFGAARQLFEPALAGLEPDRRAAVLGASAALAAPLFAAERTAPSDPDAFAAQVVEGLAWLTRRLEAERTARSPGIAVILDDAQWIDAATLRFVARLAIDIEAVPVAVVAGVRSGEAGPAHDVLVHIGGLRGARRLALAELGEQAAGDLLARELGAPPDARLLAAGMRATGGNPAFLAALADEVRTAGGAGEPEGIGSLADTVPEPVSRTVLARVRRLGPDAEALAAAVAVLGDGAVLRHAAALATLDIERAEHSADELVRAGLLEAGPALAYRQGFAAAAVHQDLPPVRRSRLHRRAAELLAAAGEPVERVGAQLLDTMPEGDEWVGAQLQEAAHAALRHGDPQGAVRILRRAVAELSSTEPDPLLMLDLAHAEVAAGKLAAIETLSDALPRIDGSLERARALRELARAQFFADDAGAATETIARALREIPLDSELAYDMLCEYLAAANISVRREAGLDEEFAAAMERWDRGEGIDHAGMQIQRASVLAINRAPRDEVIALARQALKAGSLADAPPYGLAFVWLACALLCVDDVETAEEVVASGRESAQQQGSIIAIGHAALWDATVNEHRGRLDRAIAGFQEAIAMCEAGFIVWLDWSAGSLASALIERGELAEAEGALRINEAPRDDTISTAIVLRARGRLALARGDGQEALGHFLAIRDHLQPYGLVDSALTHWRTDAASAALAVGDLARARELADEEIESARRAGAGHLLGAALRVRGLCEEGEERETYLREAVAVLRDSPARLVRAKALADLGATLRTRGDEQCREILLEALALAEACGAEPLVRRVRGELYAIGVRPRRRRRAPHGLTPAEERVARLAAEGHSNAEIARQLVVSVRTVEWHLRNAYGKLGVDRKGLAGALAAASGEGAPPAPSFEAEIKTP